MVRPRKSTLVFTGNRAQVDEVVLNLVLNARDAMPGGGECRVSTGLVSLDSAAAAGFLLGREGAYVSLVVRDTGTGMDGETQQRIFEPFFTTKGDKGLGLGMAMVFGIVCKNGGCIRVESQRGRGTAITVLFPSAEEGPLGRA